MCNARNALIGIGERAHKISLGKGKKKENCSRVKDAGCAGSRPRSELKTPPIWRANLLTQIAEANASPGHDK